MTYDDGDVACTDDALVIRRYYSPFAFSLSTKRIPYSKIEQVRRLPLEGLSGQYRMWGSGDFTHWYNLDATRPRKTVKFAIKVSGARIRPVITPNDPDRVETELTAHRVNVRND